MRIFLKLGGSLITDKDKPYTVRKQVIADIAGEILAARKANPEMELLIGHGSGSFGHFAARDYDTRNGVSSAEEWQGFQKVWHAARSLNQILVDEFNDAGLPVISLPPSASILAKQRKVKQWNTHPIRAAIENGLIPVIYGDVIFDEELGGIIYSTEDLFLALISQLEPDRILLAGKEAGVWKDYPKNTGIFSTITPENYRDILSQLKSSASIDVTGGMASKVQLMLDLVRSHPVTQVNIFSGIEKGNIQKALSGIDIGTAIKSQA
jgi:isopentenyl phosphate kinase